MSNQGLELVPGLITTREKLQEAFGGSHLSGIVTSVEANMVFVYSDPEAGAEHGYTFDGLGEPDAYGPLFHYTGAGATGPQALDRGFNKQLLTHAAKQRRVHLFAAAGIVPGSGAKFQRYIGEVAVDPVQSHDVRWNEGSDGISRTVVVFRLRPVDADAWAPTAADTMPAAEYTKVEQHLLSLTTVGLVPPEQHTTDQTVANIPAEARTVVRREGQLVKLFLEHLTGLGHETRRHQITVEGVTGTLCTDVFDVTSNVLYEAKGKASRGDVRMAIGQLLDYERFINSPGLRLGMLLPERPAEDLCGLLERHEIALVYPEGDQFAGCV